MQFVLTNYSWRRGDCLSYSVVDKPSVTPLKKTEFPYPSVYTSWTTSWISVLMPTSIHLCWDFVWLQLVRVLWMLIYSMWIDRCICHGVSGKSFLGIIHHCDSNHLYSPSSAYMSEPWLQKYDTDTVYRAGHLEVSFSEHCPSQAFSVNYCKKKLLWWELRSAHIYEYLFAMVT